MPPKQKFTKEEISKAAVEILRRNGSGSITARGLGEELGSSARPIFTVFENMNQVEAEAKQYAKQIYNTYIKTALKQPKAFRNVGIEYIRFAREEPNLFRLLFMEPLKDQIKPTDILPMIDDNSTDILAAVGKEYSLGQEDAAKLYNYLWIFTHGIATLCATGVCVYQDKQIVDMITDVCISLLKNNLNNNWRGTEDD